MLKRILITGNVARPNPDGSVNQRINVNWIFQVLRHPLALATGLQPEILLPPPDFRTDMEEWLKSFSPDHPAWHARQGLTPADLVIGFELPPNAIHQLGEQEVPLVGLTVCPIRFLDDILFDFSCRRIAGADGILGARRVPEESFYVHAGLVKAQMQLLPPLGLPARSALLVGQTPIDQSLIENGRMLNLEMFEARLKTVLVRHAAVYFKPHPYGQSKAVTDYLRRLGIRVTTENVYRLLSQDEIEAVYAISSSVLSEARYFGKSAEFFRSTRPPADAMPVAPREFLTVNFWADLLAPLHTTRRLEPDVWLGDKPNRLRKAFRNWWGYDFVENPSV